MLLHRSYILFCSVFCLLSSPIIHATSMGEPKEADRVSFSGTLVSREGNTLKIMDIRIGADRESAQTKELVVYERPKDRPAVADTDTSAKKEIKLETDPKDGLMSLSLNLEQIKKIEVPQPDVLWTYKDPKRNIGTQYLELNIVYNNPEASDVSVLAPLGTINTPRPTKIFFDSVPGCQKKDCPLHLKTFCPLIPKKDRIKRRVPFQALTSLTIDGFCHKAPENESEVGIMKPGE